MMPQRPHTPFARTIALFTASLVVTSLTACSAIRPAQRPAVTIFGEQHDQPAHQQQAAQAVAELARDGRLAAVVIEMAETGRDTRALPRTADDEAVRAALSWSERGWPWQAYRSVVMNAVQAGVPVLGGNLPRADMGSATQRAELDTTVPPSAADALRHAIDSGHCGLLSAVALPGMLRIQIARDERMAQTVAVAASQAAPGQTVVLLTGEQHAARDRGVPLHLARLGVAPNRVRVIAWQGGAELPADEHRSAPRTASIDHCAQLQAARPDLR